MFKGDTMRWLKALLGLGNPTENWVEHPQRRLEFDLSRNALCGVGLGEPIERLSFLGPSAEWKPSLVFPRKGIGVDFQHGRIESFLLNLSDEWVAKYGKFTGSFRHEDEPIVLADEASQQEALDLFGEPYWIDRDADDTVFFYEHGRIEWQIEFTSKGLSVIIVSASPLLAREEQRKAYGVTKPWPPTDPPR